MYSWCNNTPWTGVKNPIEVRLAWITIHLPGAFLSQRVADSFPPAGAAQHRSFEPQITQTWPQAHNGDKKLPSRRK